MRLGDFQKKSLEGQVDVVTYICPARLSLLQIGRNAENALKTAGGPRPWWPG